MQLILLWFLSLLSAGILGGRQIHSLQAAEAQDPSEKTPQQMAPEFQKKVLESFMTAPAPTPLTTETAPDFSDYLGRTHGQWLSSLTGMNSLIACFSIAQGYTGYKLAPGSATPLVLSTEASLSAGWWWADHLMLGVSFRGAWLNQYSNTSQSGNHGGIRYQLFSPTLGTSVARIYAQAELEFLGQYLFLARAAQERTVHLANPLGGRLSLSVPLGAAIHALPEIWIGPSFEFMSYSRLQLGDTPALKKEYLNPLILWNAMLEARIFL